MAQASQFIESGAADIGFTAMAVIMNPQLKNKGRWIPIDTALYSPIAQGVVILEKQSQNSLQAEAFYKFLFAEKAKEILLKYGYII